MPDNSSIMGFNYDTEESAVEKLKTAPERLEVFIQQIRKKEKGIFNDYEGDTPEKSTRELAKLIEPYSVTAPFYIEEDKCIGCGLCEKIWYFFHTILGEVSMAGSKGRKHSALPPPVFISLSKHTA